MIRQPPRSTPLYSSAASDVYKRQCMYSELALFIDGKWLSGEGRKDEDVINPATGKVLAALPHASKGDLDAALAAAAKGFQLWKATSAYDRAKIMRKAADLVRERYDHIAKVMTQE